MLGLIGRKIGMTQIFLENGTSVPVTVIEAGPCRVVDTRTPDKHGYRAVQIGWGDVEEKRLTNPEMGHLKARGASAVRHLREFRTDREDLKAGDMMGVDLFEVGSQVDVIGTSIGRGFQGVVKRHHFGGGPASHGNTRFRKPGSVGPGTDPSRVIKGKRMPGHMGARRTTQLGLLVAKVDAEKNLLFVRGAVPGPMRGIVTVAKEDA